MSGGELPVERPWFGLDKQEPHWSQAVRLLWQSQDTSGTNFHIDRHEFLWLMSVIDMAQVGGISGVLSISIWPLCLWP